MRAYHHVSQLLTPHPCQVRALEKKLAILACIHQQEPWHQPSVLDRLKKKLTAALNKQKDLALKHWRQKVRSWTMASPALYAYIRNQPPPRILALQTNQGPTNDPGLMHHLLHQYWSAIEGWPEGVNDQSVWQAIEDAWAPFLPHIPCHVDIDGRLLHDVVKRMKPGVAGLDAWTVREIKLLPQSAWDTLTKLFKRWFLNPMGPPPGVVVLRKRRTPIEKAKEEDLVPGPEGIRPIDVHSVLARAYSSCISRLARPWLVQVTHPSQAATHSGLLHALSKLALWAELSLNSVGNLYIVSLDLSKMYNMISPAIGKNLAVVAGMTEQTAALLTGPLVWSDAVWRLPMNAPNPPAKAQRGVSQGMSSSIVLSELVMATLIRKIHLATPCDCICYIDDVHIATNTAEALRVALAVVLQFIDAYHLSLAIAKSGLWGTDPQGLRALSDESGIPIVTQVTALGGQWQVHKGVKPDYTNDRDRVRQAEERLMRVSHLPTHTAIRAQAVSVACLPKIDFLPAPVPKFYQPIRARVRKALGLTSGAPEIIYNIPTSAVLDPPDRLFLSLFRLWFFAVRLPLFRVFLDLPRPHKSKGRLGHFLALCEKRQCEVTVDSITFRADPGDLTLRFAQGWPSLRRATQAHMKNLAFLNLQKRRPLAYAAPYQCDWRAHKRYLAGLQPYAAITMMRIWSGVAMTKAHAFTLKLEESPDCACGRGVEDVDHILWHCQLRQRNRPNDLLWWSRLPPASSKCLICPYGQSLTFQRQWKRACAWAVTVVSGMARHDIGAQPTMHLLSDQSESVVYREDNQHCVAIMRDTDYTFCVKCFVARRKRDLHFLTARPCTHPTEIPVPLGHYTCRQGHFVQLVTATWKTSSLRPRFRCCVCSLSQWATAEFRAPCSPPS